MCDRAHDSHRDRVSGCHLRGRRRGTDNIHGVDTPEPDGRLRRWYPVIPPFLLLLQGRRTGGNGTCVCLRSNFHPRAGCRSRSGPYFSHLLLFSVSLRPFCLSSCRECVSPPLSQSVPSGLCQGWGLALWKRTSPRFRKGYRASRAKGTLLSAFLTGSVFQEVGGALLLWMTQTSTCHLI